MNWDYLAGLFDGEGSIAIVEADDNKHRSKRVILSIGQKLPTDGLFTAIKEFLLQEGFKNPRVWREHKNPMEYLLVTNKADAALFLELILPHIQLKKGKAIEAITFIKTLPNHVKAFTNEEKTYIHKAYSCGVTIDNIAAQIGCSYSKIYRFLHGLGRSPQLKKSRLRRNRLGENTKLSN